MKKFIMYLEPHKPETKNPCAECVLGHDLMCIDKNYCEYRKTSYTWKKSLNPPNSELGESTKSIPNSASAAIALCKELSSMTPIEFSKYETVRRVLHNARGVAQQHT